MDNNQNLLTSKKHMVLKDYKKSMIVTTLISNMSTELKPNGEKRDKFQMIDICGYFTEN